MCVCVCDENEFLKGTIVKLKKGSFQIYLLMWTQIKVDSSGTSNASLLPNKLGYLRNLKVNLLESKLADPNNQYPLEHFGNPLKPYLAITFTNQHSSEWNLKLELLESSQPGHPFISIQTLQNFQQPSYAMPLQNYLEYSQTLKLSFLGTIRFIPLILAIPAAQ